MGEPRARAAPGWVIATAVAVVVLAVAAVAAWYGGPLVAPNLVLRWCPFFEPGLRALAHDPGGLADEACDAFSSRWHALEHRQIAILLRCLRSRDPALHKLAARMLVDHDADDVAACDESTRIAAAAALLAIAGDAGSEEVERIEAMRFLASLGDPRAGPTALLLFDAGIGLEEAVGAMASIDAARWLPEAVAAWQRDQHLHPASVLRPFAVEPARPILLSMLEGGDEARALVAIDLFSNSPLWGLDVGDLMVGVAVDRSRSARVRHAAVEAVVIEDGNADSLRRIALSPDDPCAKLAFERLYAADRLDEATIAAAMREAQPTVREQAIIIEDERHPGDPAAGRRIAALLGDDRREVARQAVHSLSAWPGAILRPLVGPLLQDRRDRTREDAIAVLGFAGDLRAEERDRALEDRDGGVVAAGLIAAARCRLEGTAAAALARLGHAEAEIRGAACSALGRLSADEAAGPLLALLDSDTDPRVCAAALIALGRLDLDAEASERLEERRHGLVAAHGEALDSPWDDL